jgi:hypothetical protein
MFELQAENSGTVVGADLSAEKALGTARKSDPGEAFQLLPSLVNSNISMQ